MLDAPKVQAMVGTAKAELAKVFYRDVLGLALRSEDAFALIFDGGGQNLRINRVPAVVPSTYAILGFHVGDIVKSARAIAAKGVVMERYTFFQQDADGIWSAPDGTKVAWFRDPDGNLLSIVQAP
jgi:catechol 2,3-dioxygenase-like lactoylglutathione lyase family enzyme